MTKQRSLDPVKLAAGKRILQSGRALQFLETRLLRGLEDHPTNRVIAQFGMDLLRKLYADPDSKIVWSNVYFPSELLWGLGVVPFFPEIGAAVGTAIGFADSALERASGEAYAVDLCTFQRALAGLALGGIFPRADAIVSVSHLCDVSGQNLANHAYEAGCPFFFVDTPRPTIKPRSNMSLASSKPPPASYAQLSA